MLPALLVALLGSGAAQAHEGPPFPILVDVLTGPYKITVWADPDLGTGTFYVVGEPDEGHALPEEVAVTVQPRSGRLQEYTYGADAQDVDYGSRHIAEVAFDREEPWAVHVELDGPAGHGALDSEVVPTPDGSIGPIGMVFYALPFAAVGFLWLKAVLRIRALRRATPA
ncbi:MAG: hypothetical protein H6739_14870 [Alphaproteobacteria bacterium]|nr:hypothetical protein [Alphaproteobacteria bacterium]